MVRDRRLVIFWDLDKAGESQTGRVGNRETENECWKVLHGNTKNKGSRRS